MKHEHCHGGQFNGVSCRQQMSTATQFCEDWLELVLDVWSCEQTNISEAEIFYRIEKYKNLLGKLDVMCSTVRGLDGLLPTEEEVLQLEKVVLDAKTLWIECGFSIKGNPKCHLIFDGHLVHHFGSAADWPTKVKTGSNLTTRSGEGRRNEPGLQRTSGINNAVKSRRCDEHNISR
jgi:hypothetical protein